MKGGAGNRQVLSSELLGRSFVSRYRPPCSSLSRTTFRPPHRHEIFFIGATCTVRALIISYSFGFSRPLILLLLFAPYVSSGNTLSLRDYVVISSLVDGLSRTVTVLFSDSLFCGAEFLVAVARVQVKSLVFNNIRAVNNMCM